MTQPAMTAGEKPGILWAVITLWLATVFAVVEAGDGLPGQPPQAFDTLWHIPDVYHSDSNSMVQDFAFIGRYHGQYWYASSDGNHEADWENRRMFLGFKTSLFNHFTLESQFAIAEDFDPFYDGLYVTFLEWENHEGSASVSAGRLDFLYTGLERSNSSKRLVTIERSVLVNQVMPGEVVGFHGTAQGREISWHGGVFSGSIEDEFTDFDGGLAATAGVSISLPLFHDSGDIHLEYLYNDGDELNNAFEPYDHIVSLWHQGQSGPWGSGIDLTLASGLDDNSDLFGFTLLPTRDFASDVFIGGDQLQLAGRYHFASSDQDQGLSFNRRYEQSVTSGKGDRYQSFYLGINYLLYSHKLKMMAGAEYFEMSGVANEAGPGSRRVDGWSFAAAVRLYF